MNTADLTALARSVTIAHNAIVDAAVDLVESDGNTEFYIEELGRRIAEWRAASEAFVREQRRAG